MPRKLILLHGWLGDPGDFDGLSLHLPHLVALPLPGHGGPELNLASRTGPVLDELAGRILDEAGGEPFTLGGYSMGGRLAAWLTFEKKVRPEALLLIAAGPGIPDETMRRDRLALDRCRAADVCGSKFPDFLERWYRKKLFGSLRERDDFGSILERRRRRDPRQVAYALEVLSIGCQPDLTRRKFEIEMMYIAGEQDRKYAALAAGWKNAKTAIVAGAGHAVHLEQPAEVARLIQEWEKNL